MNCTLDKIDLEECTIDNGIIWFLELEKPWIVKYTIDTGRAEIIDVLPKELKKKGSFGCILKKDTVIYLIPIFADDIYYYDLEEYKLKRLTIPFDSYEGMVSRKRMEVVEGGEYVYCISRWPDFILRINHETKGYEKIDIAPDKYNVNKNIPFSNRVFSWKDSKEMLHFVLYENDIIHFNPYENIFSIDEFDDVKCEMIQLDNTRQDRDFISWLQDYGEFKMVCTWSGKVYKITKDNVICRWDFIELSMKEYNRKKCLVENVVAVQEYIYYFFSHDSSIVKQNVNSGSVQCIDNPIESNYEEYIKRYHVIRKIDDRQIFLWSFSSHNAYILDTGTDGIKKIDFNINMAAFNGKGVRQSTYLMQNNLFVVDNLNVLLEFLQKGRLSE